MESTSNEEDAEFHVQVLGGSRQNRDRARLLLDGSSIADRTALNRTKFDSLRKTLQLKTMNAPPPVKPASPTDGTASGYLLHRGNVFGKWKKAWFLLKPPYLFQFASSTSSDAKSVFYVSYAIGFAPPHPHKGRPSDLHTPCHLRPRRPPHCRYAMAERVAAEDADEEEISAQQLSALEEKAGSLRL